ncbi:unnamed protein product [Amoebophrya sp. A25]|nr:unnamed protein product [Amoebophrya sp. A25]|eukprot:GSA25T00002933001.1
MSKRSRVIAQPARYFVASHAKRADDILRKIEMEADHLGLHAQPQRGHNRDGVAHRKSSSHHRSKPVGYRGDIGAGGGGLADHLQNHEVPSSAMDVELRRSAQNVTDQDYHPEPMTVDHQEEPPHQRQDDKPPADVLRDTSSGVENKKTVCIMSTENLPFAGTQNDHADANTSATGARSSSIRCLVASGSRDEDGADLWQQHVMSRSAFSRPRFTTTLSMFSSSKILCDPLESKSSLTLFSKSTRADSVELCASPSSVASDIVMAPAVANQKKSSTDQLLSLEQQRSWGPIVGHPETCGEDIDMDAAVPPQAYETTSKTKTRAIAGPHRSGMTSKKRKKLATTAHQKSSKITRKKKEKQRVKIIVPDGKADHNDGQSPVWLKDFAEKSKQSQASNSQHSSAVFNTSSSSAFVSTFSHTGAALREVPLGDHDVEQQPALAGLGRKKRSRSTLSTHLLDNYIDNDDDASMLLSVSDAALEVCGGVDLDVEPGEFYSASAIESRSCSRMSLSRSATPIDHEMHDVSNAAADSQELNLQMQADGSLDDDGGAPDALMPSQDVAVPILEDLSATPPRDRKRASAVHWSPDRGRKEIEKCEPIVQFLAGFSTRNVVAGTLSSLRSNAVDVIARLKICRRCSGHCSPATKKKLEELLHQAKLGRQRICTNMNKKRLKQQQSQ